MHVVLLMSYWDTSCLNEILSAPGPSWSLGPPGGNIYSDVNYLCPVAEALKIAEKRRAAKGKGEKERYTHWMQFQRIATRDKKAFLSDQCKEIEENNRMGKTRGLFKKIRDTRGTFHVKKGSVKDRNGMDLTEAEAIKKRWQEYRRSIQKRTSWPR